METRTNKVTTKEHNHQQRGYSENRSIAHTLCIAVILCSSNYKNKMGKDTLYMSDSEDDFVVVKPATIGLGLKDKFSTLDLAIQKTKQSQVTVESTEDICRQSKLTNTMDSTQPVDANETTDTEHQTCDDKQSSERSSDPFSEISEIIEKMEEEQKLPIIQGHVQCASKLERTMHYQFGGTTTQMYQSNEVYPYVDDTVKRVITQNIDIISDQQPGSVLTITETVTVTIQL